VNNVNHGLFGIGTIDLSYKYQKYIHDNGSEDKQNFYSHYRKVTWLITEYHKTSDILEEGEQPWVPKGTMGVLFESVPKYILRLLEKYHGLTEEELNKADATSIIIQELLVVNKLESAKVVDIMPTLIDKGQFKTETGDDLRSFLRKLDLLQRLDLVPQARYSL
jgi:hypothetical protein